MFASAPSPIPLTPGGSKGPEEAAPNGLNPARERGESWGEEVPELEREASARKTPGGKVVFPENEDVGQRPVEGSTPRES